MMGECFPPIGFLAGIPFFLGRLQQFYQVFHRKCLQHLVYPSGASTTLMQ
jgi:hypothetical protein